MKEGIKKIICSKSKTFLAFCFCFISGVGFASAMEFGRNKANIYYAALLIGIFFTIIFWTKKPARFIILCLTFFVLGNFRFIIAEPKPNLFVGQEKTFSAIVVEEPNSQTAETNYIVWSKEMNSNVYLTLPNYPAYHFGEPMQISCRLTEPKDSPGRDFRFSKYMAMKNVNAICESSSVSSRPTRPLSIAQKFFQQIYLFKQKISELVFRLWPEPDATLVGGLLYGARSGLPDELKENFTRVGLTHIVAVSGYNITIIAAAVMSSLIFIGLYRRQAFWLALVIIILFVIFTGASASAVRAGIMGSVFLIGRELGRPSRAAPALVLAGALMIFANPYILFYDAGFQLSTLATLGMIYLAEDGVIKTTLAALVATLPLILYQFGRLSIIALPVNILILWLIPYVMLAGFLSIVAGAIFFPLGQVIAYVTGFGLKYIIFFVNFFGNMPWSAVDFKISLWAMIAMYAGIIMYIRKKYAKKQN